MTPAQTFKNTLIILLTLASAFVLLNGARILLVLFIAIIVASALRPLVDSMSRRRIPNGLSILAVYLLVGTVVLLLALVVLPPVANQVMFYFEDEGRLAYRIIQAQRWFEGVISDVTANDSVSLVPADDIREAVSNFNRQIQRAIPSVVDNLGATLGDFILIFVIGAYWLTSHARATEFAMQLSPPGNRERTRNIIDEIEAALGGYVRGVFIVATVSGVLNFIPLMLLNVPNAITIAFGIGLTTTIPMIGGLLGVVLALLLTLVAAPQYLLTVFVVAFVVQQLESYFFSPRIMSTRVDMEPLLVILYTTMGFVIFGVVGALIAVPVMKTIHILLTHLVIAPYQETNQPYELEEGLPVFRTDVIQSVARPDAPDKGEIITPST